MTKPVFCELYAEAYDALYRDKDYQGECDLLERLFERYTASVRSVLDLGCGTGNHTLPLAQRGYRITGVDRSEHMLRQARTKAGSGDAEAPPAPCFLQADIRSLQLPERFDDGDLACLGQCVDRQSKAADGHHNRQNRRQVKTVTAPLLGLENPPPTGQKVTDQCPRDGCPDEHFPLPYDIVDLIEKNGVHQRQRCGKTEGVT